MNRKDLQDLAEIRLNDAQILLENKQYAGAYYLSGYVIECALKAAIAKQIKRYQFPDKNLANKVFVHNLKDLLIHSGLKAQLDMDIAGNRNLKLNWSVITQWSETSRYQKKIKKAEAEDMFSAVSDPNEGVLEWIKRHW